LFERKTKKKKRNVPHSCENHYLYGHNLKMP
jgi:hypothetical protein